jgi:GNAT superfamily N-acetyltransferase
LHRLDGAYLRDNHCHEVRDRQGQLVAFVAVVEGDARVLLDNLWVTPELIGRGIGRFACEHLLTLARRQGWNTLWVLPDPPAAGFYLKVGFSDTGERVASRVQGGPVFPVYRMDL